MPRNATVMPRGVPVMPVQGRSDDPARMGRPPEEAAFLADPASSLTRRPLRPSPRYAPRRNAAGPRNWLSERCAQRAELHAPFGLRRVGLLRPSGGLGPLQRNFLARRAFAPAFAGHASRPEEMQCRLRRNPAGQAAGGDREREPGQKEGSPAQPSSPTDVPHLLEGATPLSWKTTCARRTGRANAEAVSIILPGRVKGNTIVRLHLTLTTLLNPHSPGAPPFPLFLDEIPFRGRRANCEGAGSAPDGPSVGFARR